MRRNKRVNTSFFQKERSSNRSLKTTFYVIFTLRKKGKVIARSKLKIRAFKNLCDTRSNMKESFIRNDCEIFSLNFFKKYTFIHLFL